MSNPETSTPSSSFSLRHNVTKEEITCAGNGRNSSISCTCKSCAAAVIADCVALCCCPCAVVNILALAFFKVPVAMARKCIERGRKKKKMKMKMLEEKKKRKVAGDDKDGISGNGRVEPEIVLSCRVGLEGKDVEEVEDGMWVNDDFSAEEFWLELYEIGHLGFGRVSFTGIPNSHNKGN